MTDLGIVRRVILMLLICAGLAGCSGGALTKSPVAAARRLPVTAAWVFLGKPSSNAREARSPKWVADAARAAGYVVHGVGVWQEVPAKSDFALLFTNRVIMHCRVAERQQDGTVVVEAWTHVDRARQRVSLKPGADQAVFTHLSGPDAVAVRLGWEGKVPAPIFGRALLVHGPSSTRRGWPADVPKWVVDVLGRWHAVGGEDLGAGKWTELGPDPVALGQTPQGDKVTACIHLREHSGCVIAGAVLSSSGGSRRKSATVQPVIPGNANPGTLCSFQLSDDDPAYVVVVWHYGRPPSAESAGAGR